MAGALGRCQVCRHSVLDTFAALAGVRIPLRRPQSLATSAPLAGQSSGLRTFHSNRPLWQGLEVANDQSTHVDGQSPSLAPNSSDSAAVPWYLQVETPSPPTPVSTLLSNYDLPPLPANPPPILQAMLEHLSTSAGLSNLRLLDLRNLWPPPALGANLLMIIGTARSTKHLNVSADRLCRWLRTKYKLRPYADGLLGRQELKLKLRRRARKMKMAQAVGRTDEIAAAEDVTTGWICVNVGMVPESEVEARTDSAAQSADSDSVGSDVAGDRNEDDGVDNDNEEEVKEVEVKEVEVKEVEELDDYAGFGSSAALPRIVVQMFTEDKRLEMDLEGLWDFRNTRRSNQADKVAQTAMMQETVWREKLHEPVVDVRDGSEEEANFPSRDGMGG
ncbi:hypothetical protein DV736_g6318, partial [Chaetothyriales sp. CBS 134916]